MRARRRDPSGPFATVQDCERESAMRRGVFQEGEKVQLTDVKGTKVTVQLVHGGLTETAHGLIPHDRIIGQLPGTIVLSIDKSKHRGEDQQREGKRFGGWPYTAMRPRLVDYELSMPRGAQIMYPKDIFDVLGAGDIRRGARVLECGGGSGAMSLALLDAIGPTGHLTTIEQREDFAQISASNIELYFGSRPQWWNLIVGSFDEVAATLEPASQDRIVLDLLDPWNRLKQAGRVIAPGGVLVCYITTTTQMSRLADEMRAEGMWTEPQMYELIERTWKAEGLAVRPDHTMIGHTGFLAVTRAMAPGVRALHKRERGSKDVYSDVDRTGMTPEQELAQLEIRETSDRKVRKVLRDLNEQLRVLHSHTTESSDSTDSTDGNE